MADSSEGVKTPIPVYLYALGVALGIAALIYAVGVESSAVTFKTESDGGLPDAFWAALTGVAAMALLVERAVEVILNASGQNGDALFDPSSGVLVEPASVRPQAARLAVVLGVIVAASGVLILDTLVSVKVCTGAAGAATSSDCVSTRAWYLFRFSDVALTAGVIAGGANGLHPFVKALTSLGSSMGNRAQGMQPTVNAPRVRNPQRHSELEKAGAALPAAPVAVATVPVTPVAVAPVATAAVQPAAAPASAPAAPPADPGKDAGA
ncbi:hypothetical protein [Marinovum sp. KMM 9879]